jgi:hypothetical protein
VREGEISSYLRPSVPICEQKKELARRWEPMDTDSCNSSHIPFSGVSLASGGGPIMALMFRDMRLQGQSRNFTINPSLLNAPERLIQINTPATRRALLHDGRVGQHCFGVLFHQNPSFGT